MTPFKKNITKSIDNLNFAENNVQNLDVDFEKVFSQDTEDNIDSILENNLLNDTGSNITIDNTVENGKIDYSLLGDSFQQTYTGKNKLNNTLLTTETTSGGITCTPNNDGSFTFNETASANVHFRLSETQDFGDTTFSNISQASTTYKSILINAINGVTLIYNTGNKVTSIRIENGTTLNNLRVYPMILLKTETDESYEPYVGGIPSPNPSYPQDIKVVTGDNTVVISNSDNTQSQSIILHLGDLELCKIGDYQDTIVGTKDNWKILRNVGKVILNGSESWDTNQSTETSIRFTANVLSNKLAGQENVGLSNYFKVQAISYKDGISFYTNNITLYIWVLKSVAETINDFQTWLATHNTLVYYILATPTEETITDTTLINDLNDLYDVNMYEEQTNIVATADTGNVPLILDVTTFVTSKGE